MFYQNMRNLQRCVRHGCSTLRETSRSAMVHEATRGATAMFSMSQPAAQHSTSAAASAVRAWRQEASRFSSARLAAPSFAASAALPPPPTSMSQGKAAIPQARSASTTAVTEDGDEDASTSNSRSGSKPPSTTKDGDDEEGLPVINELLSQLDLRMQQDSKFPGFDPSRRAVGQLSDYQNMERADPLEHLMFMRESFMRKKLEMIPIPPEVRAVLYRYHWDKLLVDVVRSVDMVRKEGKVESYTAMVAVGNFKGLMGLGVGVARTAQEAVAHAYLDSYSKLTYIPLFRGHTIYHHITHSFHRMKMVLMPRYDGWGIKANSLLVELCKMLGIQNISIKVIGQRQSKFFVAQCFVEALQKQSTPYDGIEGTGVYAREVYKHRALPCGLKRGIDIL